MEDPIKLNIKVIEDVSSATFPGTVIALGGGVIQYVMARIGKASKLSPSTQTCVEN